MSEVPLYSHRENRCRGQLTPVVQGTVTMECCTHLGGGGGRPHACVLLVQCAHWQIFYRNVQNND